jgi:hypothetical protein
MITTGTVVSMQIEQDGNFYMGKFTLLETGSATQESFTLWFESPGTLTPFPLWVARSMVVSMLKDALMNKLTVGVIHDDTSAVVSSVILQTA